MSNDADPLDLAVRHVARAAQESDALRELDESERATVTRRLNQALNPRWLLSPEPIAAALGENWDHRLASAAPLTDDERVRLAASITRLLHSDDREAFVAAVVVRVRADGAALDNP